MKLPITKVEPIGTRKTFAHVHHADQDKHGFQWIDWPVYPREHQEAGQELRERRVDLDLSLREAADRLGIKPVELSGIERGEGYTCDVNEAIRLLGDETEACPDCNGAGWEDDGEGGQDACAHCGGSGRIS